jgi:DNA-binding response OmpR family regulator
VVTANGVADRYLRERSVLSTEPEPISLLLRSAGLRRILFLSDRSPGDVLPAALVLGADLKSETPSPDTLVRLPDLQPDLVVADAVPDAARTHELLTILASAGSPVGIIAVLSREDLKRFPWHEVCDDFVFPEASEGELRLRLDMIRSRRGEGGEAVVRLGPVTINRDTYQVLLGGRPLDLTYKEFELIRFLAERPGRVFSRATLLQEVWGYDFYGGTRTVDVHVRRLRAKLGPAHEHLIETVRGVGYRASGETQN